MGTSSHSVIAQGLRCIWLKLFRQLGLEVCHLISPKMLIVLCRESSLDYQNLWRLRSGCPVVWRFSACPMQKRAPCCRCGICVQHLLVKIGRFQIEDREFRGSQESDNGGLCLCSLFGQWISIDDWMMYSQRIKRRYFLILYRYRGQHNYGMTIRSSILYKYQYP